MATNVVIDEKLVKWARKVIEEKKVIWNNHFPKINFDENGRALVGELPNYDYDAFNEKIKRNYSKEFNKCLKEACDELRIKKIALKDISYYNYLSRRIDVETKSGNIQERSLPSILAKANMFWEKRMPLYRPLRKLYKKTAKDNMDSIEVQTMKSILDEMELKNIFVKYDELMRIFQSREIYISINPLDKLFSSGGEDSDSPTRFATCWSNDMEEMEDGSVSFSSLGSYSNPQAQVKIGEHPLCGMLIIPNYNEMNIFGMKFMGMLQRSHIWLNNSDIFIENIYPDKNNRDFKKTIETIISSIVPVYTNSQTIDLVNPDDFDGSSWAGELSEIQDNGKRLYLDRVSIDYDDGVITINN